MKIAIYVLFFSLLFGKTIDEKPVCNLPSKWNSKWIAIPNESGLEYGVYYFRKKITLKNKPASFIIHISADNRYKLYVNGKLISLGPTRGDTFYWNYESVDLSPYLTIGENTVAAIVWNEAQYRPEAQISVRTAFIIQGSSSSEDVLNTNNTWKCMHDAGRKPIPGYFYAASRGEMINMNESVMGDWTLSSFNDQSWPYAVNIADGDLKGMTWGIVNWSLVPSILPPREMVYQRLLKLRSATGLKVPDLFPERAIPFTVPSNTTVSLLLDQTFETNAYITFNFGGGKDAGISLNYAESLYERGSGGKIKSNRNNIEGKDFIGRKDSVISNGYDHQSFTTLNFRTYRYILLVITTKSDPLLINDIYGTFTAYPFKRTGVIKTDNKEINQILDIGWRTARLNAWETYTDCPYYEQLQYIGDTRIQAMISYYNSGDDRLARNALTLIDHSRLTEGVTWSAYPTYRTQIISTFSLWYVGMLYDFWMYRNDEDFVKRKLLGERAILDFYARYQQQDGSLKDLPYWTFVDWAGDFFANDARGKDGSAAIYDLQLLWAYEWATEMESKIGLADYARLYRKKVNQLKKTIDQKYWDSAKELYADNIEKDRFSQHVNALAILTGMVEHQKMNMMASKILKDNKLIKCSIYFKYYLNQALVKAGLGDQYLDWLDIWRENIKMGLTTWAEDSNLTTVRSDCHAWGASPNIEFFRTLLGVDSYEPGFKKIKIQPNLGSIRNISGQIPHPNGKINVSYVFRNGCWHIQIYLPAFTRGKFIWKSKSYSLKDGENNFNFLGNTYKSIK